MSSWFNWLLFYPVTPPEVKAWLGSSDNMDDASTKPKKPLCFSMEAMGILAGVIKY